MIIIALILYIGYVMAVPQEYLEMFHEFKQRYNRTYSTADEELTRLSNFVNNFEEAKMLNRIDVQAHYGINKFSDMSKEEFKSHHNGERYFASIPHTENVTIVYNKEQLKGTKTKIDWREKGAVTPVKDQGEDCGSCWAFSSTGNIEGQWFLSGRTLVSLSEQQLVSCDTTDDACDGGLMGDAFKWLIRRRQGKITTEASYPYVSGDGYVPQCKTSKMPVGAIINGYKMITKTEDQMAAFLLLSGPLSVAVDAKSWQSYKSGIMSKCTSKAVDHGVLIVGYDDTYTTPYWIIKNSWGSDWGEGGYIRVEKGNNQCLITTYPITSTVPKKPLTMKKTLLSE